MQPRNKQSINAAEAEAEAYALVRQQLLSHNCVCFSLSFSCIFALLVAHVASVRGFLGAPCASGIHSLRTPLLITPCRWSQLAHMQPASRCMMWTRAQVPPAHRGRGARTRAPLPAGAAGRGRGRPAPRGQPLPGAGPVRRLPAPPAGRRARGRRRHRRRRQDDRRRRPQARSGPPRIASPKQPAAHVLLRPNKRGQGAQVALCAR